MIPDQAFQSVPLRRVRVTLAVVPQVQIRRTAPFTPRRRRPRGSGRAAPSPFSSAFTPTSATTVTVPFPTSPAPVTAPLFLCEGINQIWTLFEKPFGSDTFLSHPRRDWDSQTLLFDLYSRKSPKRSQKLCDVGIINKKFPDQARSIRGLGAGGAFSGGVVHTRRAGEIKSPTSESRT